MNILAGGFWIASVVCSTAMGLGYDAEGWYLEILTALLVGNMIVWNRV